MDGQVHARIDSQAKVLYARHADVRSATFKEVRTTVDTVWLQPDPGRCLLLPALRWHVLLRALQEFACKQAPGTFAGSLAALPR